MKKKSALEISDEIGFEFAKEVNQINVIDKDLLIHNMSVRQVALQHLIDKDVTGNTLAVLEAWREVKFWKEALLRGEYNSNTNPLEIKEKLIKQFKEKERPKRLMSVAELAMEFEGYKEDSDWLIKIRDELSDMEFTEGVFEYSIASPEGIYLMVKELKKMYLKESEES